MSHSALTAKYRPQTFSEVAGQETVKTILSRASLEQRVAPAYLFSGTRGVGKTTIARIFAKALNCRNAPAAEPCNACDQCRAVTSGSAVDVVEIDGASNRGIDDVRRLKEVVGYAPMEGGYRIFIIDEAHMLSREAFNALLKTLEEPPARVTFVMATTEPHKFPATIISRCQHYVFKPLPESGLVAHLGNVLSREGVDFEQNALHLIARRGAGSVRDSMSLLGQVLALGDGLLTEESVRNVLGLAGQEAFIQLLEAVKEGDSLALCILLRSMLDQGLDIGFFLRELSSLWRNIFILRQSGEGGLDVVDVPVNEARRYLQLCQGFSLQHIHACWQMTLEGQRRVLTSLEPALALELLLLNLAMLPKLLSLENLSAMNRRIQQDPSGSGSGGQQGPAPAANRSSHADEESGASHSSRSFGNHNQTCQRSANTPRMVVQEFPPLDDCEDDIGRQEQDTTQKDTGSDSSTDSGCPFFTQEATEFLNEDPYTEEERDQGKAMAFPETFGDRPEKPIVSRPEWESIFVVCESLESPSWLVSLLKRVNACWQEDALTMEAHDAFALERLKDGQVRDHLDKVLHAWCGTVPSVIMTALQSNRKTREDLKAEVMQHPLVKEVQDSFGGYIIDYGQIR